MAWCLIGQIFHGLYSNFSQTAVSFPRRRITSKEMPRTKVLVAREVSPSLQTVTKSNQVNGGQVFCWISWTLWSLYIWDHLIAFLWHCGTRGTKTWHSWHYNVALWHSPNEIVALVALQCGTVALSKWNCGTRGTKLWHLRQFNVALWHFSNVTAKLVELQEWTAGICSAV